MENENYKIDKLSIIEDQEERAIQRVDEIDKRCDMAPVAFLKANYGFEKIRNRKAEPEIRFLIGAAMVKAAVLAGIRSKIDQANKFDITNSILSEYNDLTLEEIYKAFELERYGVYEERTEHYALFNAQYVTDVLKKYRTWKQNTKMQHNISPPVSIPEITDGQKKEILIKGIIRVFDEYETTGIMPEPNNYIFDELYERKIIPDGNTPKIQAYYQRKYSEAASEIKKELSYNGSAITKSEKHTIKEELQKIIDNNSDKVAARVKKIILSEYFTKLIKNDQHIAELLNKP